MKKCTGSFLILFVCATISCQKPINPEFRGINNVVISKVGMNESQVSGNAKFYNPNSFNLQLKHVDVNVFLNDKLSGHCVLDSTIDIRQLDTFYVPVSFTIDPRSIFSNALQMLVTRQVKISCDGSVKLRKSGLGFNIPVKFEQYEQLDSLLRNYSN